MGIASRFFPLRAAGFVNNPFRALSDAEWGEVAVLGPGLLAAFHGTAAHLQIHGRLGAGKTTTLLGLQAHGQDRGQRVVYEYVPEGQQRFVTPIDGLGLFLLDEAQRLSGRELSRLLSGLSREDRPGPRVVVAVHADLTPRFEAAGLVLATVDVDRLTVSEYQAILDRRLERAALPNRPRARLAEDAAPYLLATFGTDRRAAGWLLYQTFQELRAPDLIDAVRLEAVRVRVSGSDGAALRTGGDGSGRGTSGHRR